MSEEPLESRPHIGRYAIDNRGNRIRLSPLSDAAHFDAFGIPVPDCHDEGIYLHILDCHDSGIYADAAPPAPDAGTTDGEAAAVDDSGPDPDRADGDRDDDTDAAATS